MSTHVHGSRKELWLQFCRDQQILQNGVPLFTSQDSRVECMTYGKDERLILKRSPEMEALVIREVEKVIQDFHDETEQYDGLIYMMYRQEEDEVIPLYIGKSEKYGKKGNNLSANIQNIRTNRGNFCRWGYNYAYHIGDLSAWVCPGHGESKRSNKYRLWAEQLFVAYASEEPQLNEPIFFWIKAWSSDDIGIWQEFGPTRVTFLEYQLIGVASHLYPDVLLNVEGRNRL